MTLRLGAERPSEGALRRIARDVAGGRDHGIPGGGGGGASGSQLLTALSAVFFVAFLLIANIEQVREVEIAFLATAALLSSLLYVAYRRPVDMTTPGIRPGSAEEVGAVLAAADEGT